MPPGVTFKDIAQESNLFRTRVAIAYVVVVALFLILVLRLVELQVIEHRHFQTLSHNNRVKIVPVAPTRGLIFDRNGVVLAQNTPSFSLEIVPEDVGDLETVLSELKKIVAITEADEQSFFSLLAKARRFDSIPVRTRLDEGEVARFSVNRHRFPGVDVHARLSRDYPLGSLAVHLVGYVGRISEEDLQEVDAANYRGTNYYGKTGVEQAYEQALHGRVGYQHVETNAEGRTLRVLKPAAPVPGANLYLALDVSLQAWRRPPSRARMVRWSPSIQPPAIFSPSSACRGSIQFVCQRIDPKSYRELLNSPDRPLFNRALSGQYPPGSTVKPFIGLAGLETEIEQIRKRIFCPGWYRLKGRKHRYRDWKKYGHGHMRLHDAIVQSCDVYFYTLVHALGIDRMHRFMTELGFGRKTGIDLSGEAAGLMPSKEWKRQVRNQPWYPGETLITGIGQGFILSTPLQLASATATLSMRGLRMEPSAGILLQDTAGGETTSLASDTATPLAQTDPAHWEEIVKAMENVVHGRRGTARRIGVGAPYRFAGKTGTAQLFGVGQEEEYEEDNIDKKLRDHALFIAFAPVDNPRIALAIIVENGGSGSRVAAPIARKVIDHYLRRLYRNEEDDELLLTAAPSR